MTASLPLQHIIDNPLNMQGDDGPAACIGFQEEAVVGVVLPEFVAGKPERCGLVEAQSASRSPGVHALGARPE